MGVEVLRGVDLLQEAVAHDGDAVAHGHRLDLIVGHVDDGGAEALVQPRDFRACVHSQLGVEVGERLVQEEDGGLAYHGPAERHALPLAARELAGLALEQSLDVEQRRGFFDAGVELRARRFAQGQPKGEVFAHRHYAR